MHLDWCDTHYPVRGFWRLRELDDLGVDVEVCMPTFDLNLNSAALRVALLE